jgi:F-type H+-transporting ATPase subunit b
MALLQNPESWVAVGVFLFFVLLAFLKVPSAATRALDERAGKIASALKEAEELRQQARSLLDSLQARRADAEAQTAQMLEDARAEVERLEADAKAKLEDLIARRTELADRRITLAEQQAETEVKAAAAELAARIAESILTSRLAGMSSDPSVDAAIVQLGQRMQ